MPRLIYLIPIRKGSKGVPDKNMKILGGKPLVAWVVDAITASHTAAEIWVATDDDRAERYLAEAKPHVRVYRRSAESATDTAPVIEVVREFIDAIRPAPDDMLVLAQATSPFTSPDDFRRLQQSIDAAKADSYIACLRTKRFVWNPDGTPASYRLDAKPMRQAFSGTLIETGAFYASSVGAIGRSRSLLSGRIEIVETSPGTDIDIDESIDWRKAEALAKAITMIQ
ncbi:acylneuraminate cytidylyltransferase family protein [Paramuribaculum intestinale]|uniref:acylneuraminate cytidylyltransferase family protein n=1 Tax=Paramuribaculum intestinale TaxID=2094151 RepID=UPI00272D158A|nr:acylneuraminate cytidylyltransferase family protein [Paramuribaculum intestinale]